MQIWEILLPKVKISYSPKTNVNNSVLIKTEEIIDADVHWSNIPGIERSLLKWILKTFTICNTDILYC